MIQEIRFLAAEVRLDGETNLERAHANEIVDALHDIEEEAFACTSFFKKMEKNKNIFR